MKSAKRLILLLVVTAFMILSMTAAAVAVNEHGTDGDDRITGTAEADGLRGLAGDDALQGMGGNDFIVGDAGNDLLHGADDDQEVQGGEDTVFGGAGNDRVEGGSGADNLRGDEGNDTMIEGPANDAAADTIYGGDGDDYIHAGSGKAAVDVVRCGPGRDEVRADSTDDVSDDCENVIPYKRKVTKYSTLNTDSTRAAQGEVIDTGSPEEVPDGTVLGGMRVVETTKDGTVLSDDTELIIEGKRDAFTAVDESRAEPDATTRAAKFSPRCKKVWAWWEQRSILGRVNYRWVQSKHWCYDGRYFGYLKIRAYPQDVDSNHYFAPANTIRFGGYYDDGYAHSSYREGRFVEQGILGFPDENHYPWTRIWARASGSWDYAAGGG